MKYSLYLFCLIVFFSCSKSEENEVANVQLPSTLGEIVNKGLDTDLFYQIIPDKYPANENSIIFIIPASSCFNCFEDLVESLELFYKETGLNKIIVIKNNNIKDREVRFSLQNVASLDSVEIVNINDVGYLKQHDFFPKLGFIKNGKLSCIEVFEQGDRGKILNYFEFLKLLMYSDTM